MSAIEQPSKEQYVAIARDGTCGRVWGVAPDRVLLTTEKSSAGYWLKGEWDVRYRPHEIRKYLSRWKYSQWLKEHRNDSSEQ